MQVKHEPRGNLSFLGSLVFDHLCKPSVIRYTVKYDLARGRRLPGAVKGCPVDFVHRPRGGSFNSKRAKIYLCVNETILCTAMDNLDILWLQESPLHEYPLVLLAKTTPYMPPPSIPDYGSLEAQAIEP